MKISSSIVCLLLLCSVYFIKAQNLLPSTVRQIFNLEKGDSLEYHEWTVANSCGTICNWYELKTVDSIGYSILQDTLFIYFQTQVIRFDTDAPANTCGHCQQEFIFGDICPLSSAKWEITDLDSTIIYFLDTTYDSYFGSVRDSSYANNLVYNGSKQNYYDIYKFDISYSGTKEIYADSIGIVYKEETLETSANNNIEQLIYYHKANGQLWGMPYLSSGIDGISKDEPISVYPNPTEDRFPYRVISRPAF